MYVMDSRLVPIDDQLSWNLFHFDCRLDIKDKLSLNCLKYETKTSLSYLPTS